MAQRGRPKGSKNKPKVNNSTPTNNAVGNKVNNNKLEYISGASSSSTSKQPTAAEMKEWYEKNKKRLENYEAGKEAFKQIRDVSKTTKQRTITSFDRATIISYLQNISANENNLRNLSRYLYYRSAIYRKLINYNVSMFDLTCRYTVPDYSLVKNNDKNKILKSYYETLTWENIMNIQNLLIPVLYTCFLEDASFNCVWIDETGSFCLPIPGSAARISGRYFDGSFAFYVDMSYYKKYEDIIEFLGSPLSDMYSAYGGDNANKWQPLDDEHSLCFKFDLSDYETICPPLASLFLELISLEDTKDNQATADDLSIYKLLVAKLPLISGSGTPDDWALSPDLAIDYYNKMVASLPSYIGSAISPMDIEPVEFEGSTDKDIEKVENATKNLLTTSGGAQVLNSASISTGTAFQQAMRVDTEFAISSLLGQIQGFVNRMLGFRVSNPSQVKFFEVSCYTKDNLRDQLLENAQNGISTKLMINSLSGISELDTLSINFLEEDILNLSERFSHPLSTSYTQSSEKESGGQEKDGQLSDEGERTKDEEKNDDAKVNN